MEACVAANMDVERWDDPRPEKGYKRDLKLKVIAWWRLRSMIEAHTGDAQVEHQKREAEKARKR